MKIPVAVEAIGRMFAMKIQVEVDVPVDENEWEFLGYRKAEHGEHYWTGVDASMTVCFGSPTRFEQFVFRKRPTFEMKLKPGWVAKTSIGYWFWFSRKPTEGVAGWEGGGVAVSIGRGPGPNFDFPDCDWRDSLRRVG